MDEIDAALVSLNIKYGDPSSTPGGASSSSTPQRKLNPETAKRKSLLTVDPKALDSEAELKRFFGARVIASAQSNQSTKQSRQQKLFQSYIAKIRTVLVPHPKPTWPIQSGFGGMSMRELSPQEALDIRRRRGVVNGGRHSRGLEGMEGERWWTFEHDAAWRQVHLQFLGAVRSHGGSFQQTLVN